MSLTREQGKEAYENLMLKPESIAEAIVNELLLDDQSPESMMRYVSQQEWDIYRDFPEYIGDVSVPKFYDQMKWNLVFKILSF